MNSIDKSTGNQIPEEQSMFQNKTLDGISKKVKYAILLGVGSVMVACSLDARGSGEEASSDAGMGDSMAIDSGLFPDAITAETSMDADAGLLADSGEDAPIDSADADADALPDAPADALADAETDAGDPCAAALAGFNVKIKALPGNKYDYVLFDDKGVAVSDSLSNGVFETADTKVTGVKYDYVIVLQSAPDLADAGIANYATENVVELPAGCIEEVAKARGHSTSSTMSPTAFKTYHDSCPTTCTAVTSSAVKPTFHYEFLGTPPLDKTSAYHITFKKP